MVLCNYTSWQIVRMQKLNLQKNSGKVLKRVHIIHRNTCNFEGEWIDVDHLIRNWATLRTKLGKTFLSAV